MVILSYGSVALKKVDSEAGFTLVELLIVLGICAMLALIAVPRFNDYVNQSKFEAVADQYFNDINYARRNAINRSRTLEIDFTTGGINYQIIDAKTNTTLVTRNFDVYNAQNWSRTVSGFSVSDKIQFSYLGVPSNLTGTSGTVILTGAAGQSRVFTISGSTGLIQ